MPDYLRLALNFSGDVLWSSQFVIAVLCAACSWHADVAMVRAGGWRDFAAFVSIVSCVRQGFFSAGKILGNGASDDFESWPPFFLLCRCWLVAGKAGVSASGVRDYGW